MLIFLVWMLIQTNLINYSAAGEYANPIKNRIFASSLLTVDYYVIDISVQTTSDWAELMIDGLKYLTWKKVSELNLTDQCQWDGSYIYLNRSLAENMPTMTLNLVYAVSSGKTHIPFSITFQRGDIGEPLLEIKVTSAQGSYGPILYLHDQVIQDSNGLNTVVSTFDLSDLEAFYVGFGLQSSLDLFDALHVYGIQELDNTRFLLLQRSQHAKLYPLLNTSSQRRLWIATVQPGYDDTLLPGREGFVRDREEGGYYRSTWNGAIASDPDWIFITTWNEYWENTHMEPSKKYGRQYLEITGRRINEWKASVEGMPSTGCSEYVGNSTELAP